MDTTQTKIKKTIRLILQAVAVGMAVASIVLGYLNVVELGVQISLLSLGLFALAIAALQNSTE